MARYWLLILSFSLSLFSSGTALADLRQVSFSFLFGSTTLDVDGTNTYGTGWSAVTEFYLSPEFGYIFNAGASHTDADTLNFFGTNVSRIEVDNYYLQPGVFIYPARGLRLAAGPTFNFVEQDITFAGAKTSENRNFAGPFFSIGYRLPLQSLVLGAQFNYAAFGSYTQSDLFLLIGLAF